MSLDELPFIRRAPPYRADARFLARALIVADMAAALRGLEGPLALDRPCAIAALRRAGFTAQEVDALAADAIRNESLRRRAFSRAPAPARPAAA